MEYMCKTKCFHRGRLFKEGERAHFSGYEKVPEHFAPVQKERDRKKGDKPWHQKRASATSRSRR